MEDERVWAFEESLWTGDADHYRELIDTECLMVVPETPFILQAEEAIEAVAATPRWTDVAMDARRVVRPQEGMIVVAYHVRADRDGGQPYAAHCTSTYRRVAHDEWRVVQHHQSLPPVAAAK